ncbi:MAG: hypothetical protein ACRDSF_22170, partial [Pseudonocardiaceae bacterium]
CLRAHLSEALQQGTHPVLGSGVQHGRERLYRAVELTQREVGADGQRTTPRSSFASSWHPR